MKAYNVYLYLVFAVVLCAGSAYGEKGITASLYIGTGTGTNIGGTVGVGTEIRIDSAISANAAVGKWNDLYSYDVGVKYYPVKKGWYLGLNYGVIEEATINEHTNAGTGVTHTNVKTFGFSFTGGYRFNLFDNTYLSGYVGMTDNKDANHLRLFDNSSFMPRFGVMLGYDFKNLF